MGIVKLSGKPDEMLGVTCDGLASHPGGVAIFLVDSCYRNRDKRVSMGLTVSRKTVKNLVVRRKN